MDKIRDIEWITSERKYIKYRDLDDIHLDKIIKMFERNAKQAAHEKYFGNLSDVEKQNLSRYNKIEHILNDKKTSPELHYYLWIKFVDDKYWDLKYEQEVRTNIDDLLKK